jgi:hypothetical protein
MIRHSDAIEGRLLIGLEVKLKANGYWEIDAITKHGPYSHVGARAALCSGRGEIDEIRYATCKAWFSEALGSLLSLTGVVDEIYSR